MDWPLRISKFSALIAFFLFLAFAAILWGGAELVNFLKEAFGNIFKPDDAPAMQPNRP